MTRPAPLDAASLAWCCPAETLPFATTAELPDLADTIGQERAVEALRYALSTRRAGYNVFALGPDGIGKHTAVHRLLEARAAAEPSPGDLCYVSDFEDMRTPLLLRLPAGRGAQLRNELDRLLADLLPALRNAFENEEYRTRRQVIEEELKERQEKAIAEVEQEAKGQGVALIRSPMGFAFAPMADGRIVTPEIFQALPDSIRKRIEETVEALQKRLKEALASAPRWMKETRERIKQLNDDTAAFAVNFLFDSVKPSFADLPPVVAFLDRARADVIEHVEAFLQLPEQVGPAVVAIEDGHPLFRRYRVNLLVDRTGRTSAPVVQEDDPTFERLVGRIEHRAEMGALVTDLLMIRAGALHRANGGYLVIEARKLLGRPMAYDGLKRALVSGQIRIESPLQVLGVLSTQTLEPEPAPLDVKVVLLGERLLYYLLVELDPEFARLFKVAADFDERLPRDPATLELYARLLATIVRREGLRPLTRDGVGRLLEHAARRAQDSFKLSTEIEHLGDVLHEADFQTGTAGAIDAAAVQRAIDARERRLGRLRERTLEQITEGTVAIATSGTAVGQINGLSVLQLGDTALGRPSRITARVRMGAGQLVDIEREVKLGGPLHSKGVLILAGFLAATFSPERPLSLAATLVFEQSYGGIEGDSASSAELYALLSAIAQVPIRQSLAVTGSVDQLGNIQAIGGVNEKIEGFFDLCAARGLDGGHGVLIPATNVRHLMLHERVRAAVAAGRFAIWPVRTVAEGIEILTGLPAGERGPDGQFPEGTVFRRAEDRLAAMAERRRAFAVREEEPKRAEAEETA
jgi:predicted ATP-dependent protease